MASKTYNTAQIVTNTFNVSTLGVSQYSSPFVGEDEVTKQPFFFARVVYSWAGVATGDGTTLIKIAAHIITSNSPTTPANGATHIPLPVRIGTANTSFQTTTINSIGCAAGSPADGAEYCDVINTVGGNGVGGVCPFPKYWAFRFSMTGTAYTTGTITIQSVTLYG